MSSIIGSVAWPLVILVLILVLRTQIKRAAEAIVKRIADITEVTAPGVSVKLQQRIEKLAAESETLSVTAAATGTGEVTTNTEQLIAQGPILPPETDAERVTKYQRLAAEDPKAAVLVAFSEFETVLRKVYEEEFGPSTQRFVSFGKMVSDFDRNDVFPVDVTGLLRELSGIRNDVSHSGTEISSEMANWFLEAIGNIREVLLNRGFIFGDVAADGQHEASATTDNGKAAAPDTDLT